jgi:hypothetical protein
MKACLPAGSTFGANALHNSVPGCRIAGEGPTVEGSHTSVVIGTAVHSPLSNVKPVGHARSEARSL